MQWIQIREKHVLIVRFLRGGDLHAFSVNKLCLEFEPATLMISGYSMCPRFLPLLQVQVVSLQVLPQRRQTQPWLFSVRPLHCNYMCSEGKAWISDQLLSVTETSRREGYFQAEVGPVDSGCLHLGEKVFPRCTFHLGGELLLCESIAPP